MADTAKYLNHLSVCEKCFVDIANQIKEGTRFTLRGFKEGDSYFQDGCDCECSCFEDCDCSQCVDNGCEEECDCECRCSENCKCLFGEQITSTCKHSDAILVKITSMKARVLTDSKTHLLTNDSRRKLLELLHNLPNKKKERKKNSNPGFIYLHLD